MDKPDFLQECMSSFGNVPMDEFNKVWCVNCQNSKCVRNGAQNMLFNKRIENWRDKLFINPNRADERDDRYDNLRNTKFLPTNPQTNYEVKSFGLPIVNDIGKVEEKPKNKTPPNVPQRFMVEEVTEDSRVIPEPEVVTKPPIIVNIPPEPANEPVQEVSKEAREQAFFDIQNTQFVQGTVLPGGPEEKPRKTEEATEKPGSTFVFGDD